ncbi:MAG: Crp/Fnr family transcriptional regulator [Bacteroidales bacterium]|nr:Crp/Fnr family transcriptional regulator [Bacteroidales bacterium]
MEKLYQILKETLIFNGLDELAIENLLHQKMFRLKKYCKEEFVAHSNDICDRLMIVIQGSVRGEMTDFSGKTIKIEDIIAPQPLAAGFIFGRNNRFPVDIIANEPSTILILPKDTLILIMQQDNQVLKNYLDAISSRTQFLSNRIRFLSFKTIKEKVAHYILSQIGRDYNTVVLPQSQTNLADFFGVTRPSLARALQEMEREGIIRVERREITLLNKEKLNNLLNA